MRRKRLTEPSEMPTDKIKAKLLVTKKKKNHQRGMNKPSDLLEWRLTQEMQIIECQPSAFTLPSF